MNSSEETQHLLCGNVHEYDSVHEAVNDDIVDSSFENQDLDNEVPKPKCSLTIEPCLILFLFSISIQSTFVTQLLLEKTCLIHFNISEDLCSNLSSYSEINAEVQIYASQMNLYLNLIQNIPTIIFVLYLGSWSDRNGRKIPLLMPCYGNVLCLIILLINVLWPLKPEFILLSGIPVAVTGGLTTLLMSSFAYVADITKSTNRTMRIAFIDMSFAVGPILGLLLGGMTFHALGYIGTFCLCLGVTALNILYILFVIKETKFREDGNERLSAVQHILQSVKTVFLPRDNYKRAKIFLLMMSMAAMVSCVDFGGLELLFTEKKFNWNYKKYIYWMVYTITVGATGTLLVLLIGLKKAKLSDDVIGMLGCVSKFISFVTYALASSPALLYIGATIGSVGFVSLIVVRSAISKIVCEVETGKIFSLLACIENILPLGTRTLYTIVYDTTLNTFTGAFYLLAAALFLFAELCISVVFILNRRYSEENGTIQQ